MASCMECIHFNPCNMHSNIIVKKPTEGNDWELHNKVENECEHFTRTADVVEVVRCKNCIHFESITLDSGISVGLGNCKNKNGINLYPNETDFCSYGERSDT